MRRAPQPPQLARALVMLLLREEMREIVLGDLDEEFTRTVAAGGVAWRAKRRYWRQAIASITWRYVGTTVPAVRPPEGFSRATHTPVLAGMAVDLRHAARVLRRTPGFTAVAALSLAIGVGTITTVYNVIRTLLLVPLPVERPHQLTLLYWGGPPKSMVRVNQINSSDWRDPSTGRDYASNFTYPMFAALRDAAGPAADLFAFNFLRNVRVSIEGQTPVIVGGLLVSGRYASTMRFSMAIGRPLRDQDDRADAPPVVVLSHGFWTRMFGADQDTIGRVIRVNGAACEIVGVTARGYRGLSQGGFFPATDVTIPLSQQPAVMPRWGATPAAGASLFTSNLFWVRILARVATPTTDMSRLLDEALRQQYARLPGATPADLGAVSVRQLAGARGLDAVRTDVERPLQLLAGVAGVVLTMACLNLAGLMLARGVARQHDLAVRRALGAGRGRVIRVLLAESLILAGISGVLGTLLSLWAGPVVTSMLTTGLGATGVELGLDWPLVAIAVGVSTLAALLAGVIPALRLSGQNAAHLTHRSDGGGTRFATGRVLIALQIAASVPLLVGAGLLLGTVHNLSSADLGFNPDGLVIFRIDPTLRSEDAGPDLVQMYDRIFDRVRALPGVTAGALVENVLVSGRTSNTDVFLDGVKIQMSMNAVGSGFFATMDLPIVAGRPIGADDRQGAPTVVVINETAAAKYFPGQSPIGRRLVVGRRSVEIVGVAGTALYRSLRTPPQPSFYDSYAQRSLDNIPGLATMLQSGAPSPIHVVLRTSGPTDVLAAAIPPAVREAEPELPIVDVRTQNQQIAETIARERMFTRLLIIFGGFAVTLACVGLYGVTAYSVARRTSEIGIRVALGAQRTQVVWLILRQVLLVASVGVALGVPMALGVGPVVAAMLFGLTPHDALTIVLSAAAMLGVALAAGWLPARRAARLPVLTALRRE
jgi:predicted permease